MALRGSALDLSASVMAAALALTGCTPAEPTPTDTASVAPEPTETESATPTPTETSTDTPETSIAAAIDASPEIPPETTTPQPGFQSMFAGLWRVMGVTGFEPVTSCM